MFSIRYLLSGGQRLIATLPGHIGPVNCLAISPGGNLMASGGADGLKIWNLKTLKEIDLPHQTAHERGQVSCVFWITRQNEAYDSLCYGNALGYLVFLQHRPIEDRFETIHSCRIGKGGEILALTADMTWGDTTRIATSTRDKCVQVWAFDSSSRTLLPIHSNFYEDTDIVPKILAFDNNTDRDLYVFGLYDGGLYGGVTSKTVSKLQLGSPIGNAAIDLDRRLCVIDNAGNGFDLYKMDSGLFVKNFPTKQPKRTYPKGVTFADNTQAVVGGSDHGLVYVFERKTGKVLTTLKHAKDGGVETIGAHDDKDGGVLLASATGTGSVTQASPICLWKWTPPVEKSAKSKNANGEGVIMRLVYFSVKAVMVFATLAYFLDIFEAKGGYTIIGIPYAKLAPEPGAVSQELQEYIRQTLMAEMKQAQKGQDIGANGGGNDGEAWEKVKWAKWT